METINNLCAGCDVREPYEHRCHGEGCSCDMLSCKFIQGRATQEERRIIVMDWLAGRDREEAKLMVNSTQSSKKSLKVRNSRNSRPHAPKCCCEFNPIDRRDDESAGARNCCIVHNENPHPCYAEPCCLWAKPDEQSEESVPYFGLPIKKILAFDEPYPLPHVLSYLVKASQALLKKHDYDKGDYEEIERAIKKGNEILSFFPEDKE